MDIDYFFGFGILAIIIFCIVRYFAIHKKAENKETLDYNEMEKIFFNKISEKNRPYKLLNIYFPFDLMIIKSLFISEQIPYYVEFEHLMRLKPFVQIINYNNTNLYILEEDYNDAIIVLENYLTTKTLNNYRVKEKIRNLFELLVISWVVYSPLNNLGIEINYKSKDIKLKKS
jgi:hypothetical protein